MFLVVVPLCTCQGENFQSDRTCSTSPPLTCDEHVFCHSPFVTGANNLYSTANPIQISHQMHVPQKLDKGEDNEEKCIFIVKLRIRLGSNFQFSWLQVFTALRGNNYILPDANLVRFSIQQSLISLFIQNPKWSHCNWHIPYCYEYNHICG